MTGPGHSALLDLLVERGGVTGDYHGRTLVRHFGDPSAEYRAAVDDVAVFDRSHRRRLRVRGRAPGQMLKGVLTGRMPPPPVVDEDGLARFEATYHALLTAKGKMVSDLWMLLTGDEESGGYLLDVPVAGYAGLRETFTRVLPPRFAAVEDVSEETASLTFAGPAAAGLVSRLALGLRTEPGEMSDAPEGAGWLVGDPGSAPAVVRGGDVWPASFTAYGSADALRTLWTRAVDAGARPAGLGVWSTLRVEAGRPVFGTDMDASTIPNEAGIEERAIDDAKGCYTGQEVIVRIRDRGHVNRHLRLLKIADGSTPKAGTELYAPDDPSKVIGEITSAVQSPRYGGVAALAYVRRGVDTVLVDGTEVSVPS